MTARTELTVVDMSTSLLERVHRRLARAAREQSNDRVHLAGVGFLGVRRFVAYEPRGAAPLDPSSRRTTLLPFFESAQELLDMVNGRGGAAASGTDDEELDALAARILAAFVVAHAVDVPGLGRFEIRTKDARRGRTKEALPAIVPGRALVAFVASQELKRALLA